LVFNLNKPGFVALQVSWDHFVGAARVEIPRQYTIKLEPGSTIGGIVQDENGRPIAGADVRISVPSSGRPRAGEPLIRINVNQRTRSDQAGRWKCDEVPDQPASVMVSVSHANYVVEGPRRNISPFVRSPEKLAELRAQKFVTVLKEGVTVRGLVRNRQGKPVEGAQLVLIGSPIPRSATTDAEGRFELAHLPDGDNRLSVRASGYAPATQQIVAVPNMAPIEIEIESGRTVSGRVVDRRGKPVPGAMVSFDPGEFEQERNLRQSVTSDGNGRFKLAITDDPGSLVVHQQMVRATRLLSPSDTDVIIELRTQPVIVRGEVTDSQTG
jgi:protocatechuate 3,4-dioxygenase beta subunit